MEHRINTKTARKIAAGAGVKQKPISLRNWLRDMVKIGKRFMIIWKEGLWARSDHMHRSSSAGSATKKFRNTKGGQKYLRP